MGTVVQHPSALRALADAADKLKALHKQLEEQSRMAWAGMLATNFSDDELRLLYVKGFLSDYDRLVVRDILRGRE